MREPQAGEKISELTQAVEPEAPVAPAPQPPARQMFRALRHRQYRLFWTGNFLSNTGTWMQNVAQGWLVLTLTDSPFMLGLVGFTSWVPVLFFTLLSGVIADHSDRRRMMMLAQTAMMTLAALLAILTMLEVITAWQILIISFLAGTAAAMNAPAYQASVPELVPEEDLTNAIALNSAQFNLSRVVGPALAGWAMAWVGVAGCFYMNAASFLALLFALSQIRLPTEGRRLLRDVRFRESLRDAFGYVHNRPLLRTLILLVALASICGMPYVVLMPVFARDILHVGPQGLGYLMGAAGVGALGGALLMAWRGDRPRKGSFALRGALVFYAGLILFAQSKTFGLSLAMMVVVGAAMVSSIATVNNLLQKYAAPQLRGRIMAMHAVAFLGFAPIGSLIAGALAERVGAALSMQALCAMAFAITAVVAVRYHELRALS